MNSMNFDELVQLQVLKHKSPERPFPLIDKLVDEHPEMRQMCAKVHPSLIDRLDQVTNLLDMSKREFIEAAVSDALARAEEAIERSGALDQGSL
jgi:hypothetical protein